MQQTHTHTHNRLCILGFTIEGSKVAEALTHITTQVEVTCKVWSAERYTLFVYVRLHSISSGLFKHTHTHTVTLGLTQTNTVQSRQHVDRKSSLVDTGFYQVLTHTHTHSSASQLVSFQKCVAWIWAVLTDGKGGRTRNDSRVDAANLQPLTLNTGRLLHHCCCRWGGFSFLQTEG